VFTDVCFGPKNLGLSKEEIEARATAALQMVGLKEKHWKKSPFELSGGQKRRVAIAGILAMQPDCMIFHESTATLDPLGRRDIMNTIEKLNREHGITIIMITHYMDEAARANRIVVIDDGEIIMDGKPQEIFANPEKLEKCGLDVPQCVRLVHSLKKHGINIEGECHTPTACADAIERALKKR
jgi:energy-coupling factor transporter ATP-binding protein EcfA2